MGQCSTSTSSLQYPKIRFAFERSNSYTGYMSFVHVHASGRFDRSPDSLESALDSYVYREHADLITLTEVSGKPRSSKLVEAGWGYVQSQYGGRKSDSAIMFKKSVWKLLDADLTLVVPGNGKGVLPVWAVFGVLEHIATGKVVVVSSAHMPRSVEGSTGFAKDEPARVKATLAGSAKWRETANSLLNAENGDAVLLAADWNMSIRKAWVRDWFKRKFPKFTANWQGRLPERGTLGKRIIDIALLKGLKVLGRKILPHNKSSDHTAYREVLSFKA